MTMNTVGTWLAFAGAAVIGLGCSPASEEEGGAVGPRTNECIAVLSNVIAYVPLDGSSPIRYGPPTALGSTRGNGSLGLHAGHLYTCTGMVTRIALTTGETETTETPCASVTADDASIYVVDPATKELLRFVDHASVVARQPAERRPSVGTLTTRIAMHHGAMITAPLRDETGWITGVSQLDDGSVVLREWLPEHDELRVFDANGVIVRTIATEPATLDGIVCH